MSTNKKQNSCGHRSVYLVTYSQVDLLKCGSRETFAEMVTGEFDKAGKVCEHWVSSCENHKGEGLHFHLALKLNKVRRWKYVRDQLAIKYGINVNFQEFHTNYYDAYKYVTKEDVKYATSENHPVLHNTPPTKKASMSRRMSSTGCSTQTSTDHSASTQPKPSKRKRLELDTVYDIIVDNKIHDDDALCLLAWQQKQEGKKDLQKMVLSRTEKTRCELIKTAWKMENAHKVAERRSKSRLELLQIAAQGSCAEKCDGNWLTMAFETLHNNNLDVHDFCTAVKTLLIEGRGKGRNIYIHGNANCGKSFLLKPLSLVYNTFVSPASGTFAWVGAEKCEVVFLNDFRWSEKIIPWSDLLNLLEGAPIHIPAPKTHFAEDPLWIADTPIFATSSAPIRKISTGILHEAETEMMNSRWKLYHFKYQISHCVDTPACGRCFAQLIIGNTASFSILGETTDTISDSILLDT